MDILLWTLIKKKIKVYAEEKFGKKILLKQLHNMNTEKTKNIDNSDNILLIVDKLCNEYGMKKILIKIFHHLIKILIIYNPFCWYIFTLFKYFILNY